MEAQVETTLRAPLPLSLELRPEDNVTMIVRTRLASSEGTTDLFGLGEETVTVRVSVSAGRVTVQAGSIGHARLTPRRAGVHNLELSAEVGEGAGAEHVKLPAQQVRVEPERKAWWRRFLGWGAEQLPAALLGAAVALGYEFAVRRVHGRRQQSTST